MLGLSKINDYVDVFQSVSDTVSTFVCVCVSEEAGSREKDSTNKNQMLLLSFSWSGTFCELECFVE